MHIQREIFKYVVLKLRTFVLENRVGTMFLTVEPNSEKIKVKLSLFNKFWISIDY